MNLFKKTLISCFSVVLLIMYMVASMGMGLHECSHDGTKKLIVFFGESPCEYAHSHIDSHGHLYTHTHLAVSGHIHKHLSDGSIKDLGGSIANTTVYQHDGHCCKTTAFVLSHEQRTQDCQVISAPSFICIGVLPMESASFKGTSGCFATDQNAYCMGDEPPVSQVFLPAISQFLI